MSHEHHEIEVRFLEIDKNALINKLISLGAEDFGEDLLSDTIYYDKALAWQEDGNKHVRLRQNKKGAKVTYKNHFEHSATGTIEYEISVDNPDITHLLLEAVGLEAYRKQEKKRHSLKLDEVMFDIDTWPRMPTYVELEGPSEDALKIAAEKVGLSWEKVIFENPRTVIEKYYNIPVGHMKYFTFDRFE